MIQKQSFNVIKGMRQDISPSKANPEYIFDARNIRLTARGNDTLLSISNEQGTSECSPTDGYLIQGIVLGYCVLNKFLVVFSRSSLRYDRKTEYITRVYYYNNEWRSDILYSSHSYVQNENGEQELKEVSGKLNFGDTIQTLGVYENENIQKVYWVDGVNQPRVINIVKDKLLNSPIEAIRDSYNSNSFDFIPKLQLNEQIDIKRISEGNGKFLSGIIQYAFTYYNKYGQESNIFYVSDLNYVTYQKRGGSPEDTISNSFQITINNLDNNFDYIRIYSIHRSSIDATPYVKKIIDLPISSINTQNSEEIIVQNQYEWFETKLNSQVMISIDSGVNWNNLTTYTNQLQLIPANEINSFFGIPVTNSEQFYKFTKEEFPNLRIQVENNTYTYNDVCNAIYISPDTTIYSVNNGRMFFAKSNSDNTSRIALISYKKITADVTFIDNNLIGESVDPTFLLYVGGEEITAQTLQQKDNTLFLGNLNIKRPIVPDYIKQNLKPSILSSGVKNKLSINIGTRTINTLGYNTIYYKYSNQLTESNPATFKTGEHYRLGLQFQYENGKWSEPIPINYEYTLSDLSLYRPSVTYEASIIKYNLPKLYTSLSSTLSKQLIDLGYKRVRAIIVNPSPSDRLVLLQGMLCPTVYTNKNQEYNNPYAQSSWFLRPFNVNTDNYYDKDNNRLKTFDNLFGGGDLTNSDESVLKYSFQQNGVFYDTDADTKYYPYSTEFDSSIDISVSKDSLFRVNQKILTFHSPDIEFDDSVQNIDGETFTIKRVGKIEFDSNLGDISIQTSSPVITSKAQGFKHFTTAISTAYVESSFGTKLNDAGRSLVSSFCYEDDIVDDSNADGDFRDQNLNGLKNFFICPWQGSGSLNNDINRPANGGTRSSVLKRKVISNIKTSFNNAWENPVALQQTQIGIFNSNEVSLLKINDKNYYGNVDTLITSKKEVSKLMTFKSYDYGVVKTVFSSFKDTIGDYYEQLRMSSPSIRMKYKSTPHAVFQIDSPLTGETDVNKKSFLYLAEIQRTSVENAFGGISDAALQANQWIPSGLPVTLDADNDITIDFLHGDCYYQRYDCLKTYPFTQEDENSIVEIGSFMVETRVNIDGRYDRNRGMSSNLNITPQNFNLWNPIYSQKDNFFNYRILDDDFYKLNNFPNTITWSKEKMTSEEVDTWTNVTMTNTFDMDGNLGQIQSIENYNNELYCFQDKGISRILFNNRVQIPTGDNVPIEISNGYKVQGKMYLSNTVGCQNQKAIKVTPNGIYFSDLYNSGIYLLNQQGMQDISTPRGFTNWVKECQPNRLYYDTNNGDLYLIGNGYSDNFYKNCLCFSEKINEFTSFMDYYSNKYMFNIQNNFYAIKDYTAYHYSGTYFMQMFSGDYMKDYHITYIANQNPTNDKIFNTLEFRADSLQDNNKLIEDSSTPKSPNICPFNKVTVWNEYQEGTENLSKVYGKPSALKEKFRTWRINIPRDNVNKRDRIRNPWAYIKLEGNNNTNRMQLHDMQVWYYDNDIWKYQQK